MWACLVQSGHFDASTLKYTSASYLPGGDATKAMEEAGFVWHPFFEISADDLQAGDILVKNGHVEIFSHFDNSVEYAYSWGKVYTEEPARKSANTGNINTKYTGIWRLESE